MRISSNDFVMLRWQYLSLAEGMKMLGTELEKLLETLFEDDDNSTSNDITILRNRISPFEILLVCCTYNYGAYSG